MSPFVCKLAGTRKQFPAHMVLRLPPQPELQAEFQALQSGESTLLGHCLDDSKFSIWECKVNALPEAIAYWIGQLPNFYAYLVVQPLQLNERHTLEAVRGWVDPEFREKGLFSSLMCIATRTGLSLVGDREGMTDLAYAAWMRASGFNRSYFDTELNAFVDESAVPQGDCFTYWAQGKRFLLVLDRK